MKFRADIMAMANKIPGFTGFTGFKIGLFASDILLPMPEFTKLYRLIVTQDYYQFEVPEQFQDFSYGFPKARLLVNLKDNISEKDRQMVKNAVLTLVDQD